MPATNISGTADTYMCTCMHLSHYIAIVVFGPTNEGIACMWLKCHVHVQTDNSIDCMIN